jgi:hypothetical protein
MMVGIMVVITVMLMIALGLATVFLARHLPFGTQEKS